MTKELLQLSLFILTFCTLTYGEFGGSHHHKGYGHGGNDYYHHAPPKYNYAYGVQDSHYGPNFGHSESRDGYSTKGEYYVHLPDGRIQTVKYTADKYGFHPIITYSGKAHFPAHKPHKPKHGYH